MSLRRLRGTAPASLHQPTQARTVAVSGAGASPAAAAAAGLDIEAEPGPLAGADGAPAGRPRATLRLQFHAGFTLDDARAQVPYFAALGVSHLYASPIFTARAGSAHGYDGVDPTLVSIELGGEPALRRLVAELRAHGMGLILDIVPNHLAASSENAWWADVLTWGPRSRHALWFDIDWRPADPTLRGKVLLPVLGRPYGQALGAGEIGLAWNDGQRRCEAVYFDHRFPLSPAAHAVLLREVGAGPGGSSFQSAALAFDQVEALAGEAAPAAFAHALAGLARLLSEPLLRARADAGLARFAADPARLHRLLESQCYRLAWWRTAPDEINWRRFFDVHELVGMNVDRPEVFDAMHATLLRLVGEGLVDGVRVDHVDGLADPGAYCRRLRAHALMHWPHDPRRKPFYLVVEKILARGEALRAEWAVDGTSGYDFMNQASEWLHRQGGEAPLGALWAEVSGRGEAFEPEARAARRELLQGSFSAQLEAAVSALHGLARAGLATRDLSAASIRRALTELLVHFPVYRTYALDQPDAQDIRFMAQALAGARHTGRREDRMALRAMVRWLSGKPLGSLAWGDEGAAPGNAGGPPTAAGSDAGSAADQARAAAADALANSSTSASTNSSTSESANASAGNATGAPNEAQAGANAHAGTAAEAQRGVDRHGARAVAVRRFHQLSAPLAAKAVEDTAFYRHGRLLSRNDVGFDPAVFASSTAVFHRHCADRRSGFPGAMLASATHDHKRGEDVRARLAVLSCCPSEWRSQVLGWRELNAAHRVAHVGAPSPGDEAMLYQTLLGAWPLGLRPGDGPGLAALRDRVWRWQEKALHEAKLQTSWTAPQAVHEAACKAFLDALLDAGRSPRFLSELHGWVARVAEAGAVNGLAQTLLKFTVPGVPDTYQGCEFWDLSLVDPDNRQPVDFGSRADGLPQALEVPLAALRGQWRDGRIKQALIARLLACRAAAPALFAEGEHLPIAVEGDLADRFIAFERRLGRQRLLVVAARWPFVEPAAEPGAGLSTPGGAWNPWAGGGEAWLAGWDGADAQGAWRDVLAAPWPVSPRPGQAGMSVEASSRIEAVIALDAAQAASSAPVDAAPHPPGSLAELTASLPFAAWVSL